MWNFVEVTSKHSIGAAFCSRAKKKKKVLRKRTEEEGEVAEAAEELIIENCKELDIEVIDMAVNVDHVHLFIKSPFRKSLYGKMLRSPPKYSLSWIAKRLKGGSNKRLRNKFPNLREWCPGHL